MKNFFLSISKIGDIKDCLRLEMKRRQSNGYWDYWR
jgi:hypothetical protein